MSPRERALGLARLPAPPPGPADAAEARLRALLDDIGALDRELEACSAELAAFAHRWERALGDAFAELAAAERLVRTLQALEDGLAALAERLRSGAPPERPRRDRRRAAPPPPDGDPSDAGGRAPAGAGEGGELEPLEDEAAALKRLYRRLARLLHPDLARDAGEEARRSGLMAHVNAAYARGDLAGLQVIAERLGAGEVVEGIDEAERLARIERRIETLRRIAASLARERDRLRASDTERLRAEAERRRAAGGDLVEETRAELAADAEAARADARARLSRAAAAAAELSRARRKAMDGIERRGPTGARRAFDPLGESALVRQGAARLERRSASAEARALARALEDAARAAPWEVALTCLAFFAEEGGRRVPEAMATAAALEARWDALRAGWPGAPDLGRMLARLPRHLVVGAREGGGEVHAGVQLAAADLAAGVRIALDRPAVAEVARAVLAALGPEEACPRCRARGPARHLYRTRGLDALHGIACAACGAVLRSYWRYGEVDGLEALAPHALRLGLVAEVTAALAGTAIGFQLLPAEAEALTAERLRRRFAELYLGPCEVDLAPAAVQVLGDGGPLGKGARVRGRGPLRLAVAAGAGTTAEELLELLRSRIERRFRR
ncbi:heat shock protein DnaJ domain protein [Anaeromyxobacter dehalogenans 2CP-1]|uniref:Heat shock protein DnaJ domain protein n=1 Tax=Anaeromyxobacter dehalogenans (strain ATCC BAA-258 / DSM 21875 / 2CP-1) TaxID=455488 RepID=B8JDT3_ANAD2|nr:molecular chaperone DnaJ [Anaeromyxobacter dehalogenans]ACL64178.1 heat shock protein DnaJ domain protein [Anaeromyxobacter dehalogenans 2CP-1]